jgi:hypothetical protein
VPHSFCRVGTSVVVLAGLWLPLVCLGQGGAYGQGRTNTKCSARRGGSPAPSDPKAPVGVYPTAHGVLKSISGSQLFVEMDDDHEMKFRITHKTKSYNQTKDAQGKVVSKEIKTSSLQPGQTVDIDMESSLDGAFEAVRIVVVPEAPNVESSK